MKFPNICSHLRVTLKHSALAIVVAAGLGVGGMQAQVTRTYTNGQNNTTDYSTSAPNDPTTLTIASGSAEQSGILSGTGAVIKSGAGQLTIKADNTYSGGTTINNGTLRWNYTTALVDGLGTGPVTLNDGTLYLWRVNAANPLTINGGSIYSSNGFGNNWTGPITLNADFNCENHFNLTCSNTISGVGGVNKSGGGTDKRLTFSGTNSYTGPTSVATGILQCDNPDALGSGDLSISSSGGAKVDLNYTGTKAIGSLTLGGVPQTTPGTYGSLVSDANFKSAYFEGTGTVSSGDPATAAYITSFGANVPGSSAVIDPVAANAAAIAWILPAGTDLAALAPDFVLTSGATCSDQTSGAIPIPGFDAGPVVYTVVSPDTSVTNVYTVTATVLPSESTLIWNVGGGGDWDLSTSNWVGQSSGLPTPFFDGVNVIFDKTAGGTIAIDADMSPLSTTVNATSGTYTFEGGPIATGSLIKDGGGQLTINADNSYDGGTTIDNGTLRVNFPASTTPLGTGPVTLNDGTLYLWRVNAANSLTITGGSVFSGNGFGNNWNGPITLDADLNCNTQYKLNCSNTVSGAGGFIKTGGNQLILAGSNTFTGAMTVQAGTLAAASLNSVSGGTATSKLGAPTTVTNGTISLGATTTAGTLLYSGPGETTDRVIKMAGTTGGAILSQTGTPSGIPTTRGDSGLLKFTSNVSIPGSAAADNRKTLTLTHVESSATGTNPGSGEISGSIGDSLAGTTGQLATSVTKAGAGTWTLSGANTYSGATKVQAGTLAFRRADALGGGALDISSGAMVRLDYLGTRQISSLTFDAGTAQPDGTYGSSASLATYKDDTRFAGPGTVTVGVIASPTTTTLERTAGTDPSNGGTAVTFTATVAGTAPTGSVMFYDGLTLIGTDTLDGSYQASFTTATLGGGTHAITALYAGNAGNPFSASTALAQTVVDSRPASSTTLALTGGTNPSSQGAAVTFTATIAGTAPTGNVTFYDGDTELGSSALNGSAQASLTTSGLAVGWRAITARYEGDATHMASASTPPLFLTVNPPAGNGKVKVFILAGQSNMVAYGRVETGRDPNNLSGPEITGGLGTLRNMLNKNPDKYGYLADPANPVGGNPGWITRGDVWVTYYGDASGGNRKGDLDANFGAGGDQGYIGPEYGFGLVTGSQLADQVLLIKIAWGGKSLAVDFRPPGAVLLRGGTVGSYYTQMVDRVHLVLDNLGTEFPAYTGGGYEIAGFGWHQGWNDRDNSAYRAEYEANLTNLIEDLRDEFGVPNMPVSIGVTGQANANTSANALELIAAQTNVSNPALHPEFAGTVASVDTRPFDYGTALGVNGQGYHWNFNGESQFNIGESMGLAMMTLQPGATGSAFQTWASNPAQGLTAGVNDGPLDDPDFDGLDNLLEFVLGGDPLAFSAELGPTISPAGGGTWLFEYERSNASAPPATIQVVEYGTNLEIWTEVEIPLTSAGSVTITPDSPSDQVRVAIPNLGPTGFARLKVSE